MARKKAVETEEEIAVATAELEEETSAVATAELEEEALAEEAQEAQEATKNEEANASTENAETQPVQTLWASTVGFPLTVRVPVGLAHIAGRFVKIQDESAVVDPRIVAWMMADINHRWKFDDVARQGFIVKSLSSKREQ